MKLRFESQGSVPYIQIDCIEPMSGKDIYYDSLENFLERAVKHGLKIEKTCSEKLCKRHYRIIPKQ